MANRGLTIQQCIQNVRPAVAIESTSIFDGTSKIAAKTKIQFNLIQIISLVCLLMVSTLDTAITIVRGDPKGFRHGRSRSQQRGALSRLVRRLLRHKNFPSYHNICTEGVLAPVEARSATHFRANRP